MDPITYDLRRDARHSDRYYQEIATFTETVVAEAEARLGVLVAGYRRWLAETEREPLRTTPEYLFELLTLGVLWRIYANHAPELGPLPRRVLAALARWRERGGAVKVVADRARGVLSMLFLSRNGHRAAPAPDYAHFLRLVDWLEAVGDFKEEVRRLRGWQAYWAEQPAHQVRDQIAALLALAVWFEARSLDALGAYTPHVERFLQEEHPSYRWRENRVFCGRQRVEYHLNMVGAQIMNTAFREAFLATARKIVFVPPCMRARRFGGCEATTTPYGARCAACEPGCRVHHITKLGEKHGFAVFMLPDDLAGLSPEAITSPGATSSQDIPSLGVIGVSCALTNIFGGWKTRRLGIPAQGVLLDYVGCHWHWHKNGIPTDTNVRQILRALDVAPRRGSPSAES